MEAAHDRQADVFAGIRGKQSDYHVDSLFSARLHDLADSERLNSVKNMIASA
jgi:hypothetical protein